MALCLHMAEAPGVLTPDSAAWALSITKLVKNSSKGCLTHMGYVSLDNYFFITRCMEYLEDMASYNAKNIRWRPLSDV